ncbi:MAG: hypothetical protein GXP25_18660 [Planctomycetes bacterium]|nr:hypothetical protein [Planctomycetota bacterium]
MAEMYFAQCTDLHVGLKGHSAEFEFADSHLAETIREINSMADRIKFILMTGDQVTSGSKAEWDIYFELTADCKPPRYHVGANHDMGGKAEIDFEEAVGPRRQCFDEGGIRFFTLDEYEVGPRGWRAWLKNDTREWLEEELAAWHGPSVVAFHAPLWKTPDGEFVDMWKGSNGQDLLDILKPHNILAMITGHWHRNCEWNMDGTRLINTGALLGAQYIATDPYWFTGTRPGYRLFCWDGAELRTLWREIRCHTQSQIVWIGGHHTGGPRPQVKPCVLSGPVTIRANAFAPEAEIETVELGVGRHFWFNGHRDMIHVLDWFPMERKWAGLWTEWEHTLDPTAYEEDEYAILTRARRKGTDQFKAQDAVPVRIARSASAPLGMQQEMLFTLWGMPVEDISKAQ